MEFLFILILALGGFVLLISAIDKQRAGERRSDSIRDMIRNLDKPMSRIRRHFLLLSIVEHAYKQRKMDPNMRELCIQIGRQHVAEFPEMIGSLKREYGGVLPRVPTFQYLATALTECGLYDEAVSTCETALEHGLDDGTESGFEGRIERIRKRQAKEQKG